MTQYSVGWREWWDPARIRISVLLLGLWDDSLDLRYRLCVFPVLRHASSLKLQPKIDDSSCWRKFKTNTELLGYFVLLEPRSFNIVILGAFVLLEEEGFHRIIVVLPSVVYTPQVAAIVTQDRWLTHQYADVKLWDFAKFTLIFVMGICDESLDLRDWLEERNMMLMQ